MLLVTHIVIALSSLLLATLITIKPSRRGVIASNVLIGSTLASGSLLLLDGAQLLDLCLSGLIYSIVAVGLTLVARRRLQAVTAS